MGEKPEIKRGRGRPKKENTRDAMYSMRFNAEEDAALKELSELTGMTTSEIMRVALYGYLGYMKGTQEYGRKR